jgi:hypothetical protein
MRKWTPGGKGLWPVKRRQTACFRRGDISYFWINIGILPHTSTHCNSVIPSAHTINSVNTRKNSYRPIENYTLNVRVTHPCSGAHTIRARTRMRMCDSTSKLTVGAYFAFVGNTGIVRSSSSRCSFLSFNIRNKLTDFHELYTIQTPLLWFPTIEKIIMVDTRTLSWMQYLM